MLAASASRATNDGIRREMPDAKLVCAGLTKRYGDFVALKPVDIRMPAGEFLTLLGPSGSGKTTLLMIIAGLIEADGGDVVIDGRPATGLPSYARDIGMVFQSYALFPHLTVFENIAFPLRMRRWSAAQIDEAVGRALELVRLSHVAQRFPRELSGGQQQRIALARCIVYRPSIILMDEPLGALDKKLRDHMQFEIKQLQRDLNATVLYVTHDQDEAMAMSDRICLMNAGGIEQIGAPSDLYFHPVSRFVADFLGESNLLAAQVRQDGSRLVADVFGHVSRPNASPTITAGSAATLMIRPEGIVIGTEPGRRRLTGKITLSTMLGGVTRTVVRLDAGPEIVAKSLTLTRACLFAPGASVHIDWPDEAGLLLDRDSVQTPHHS
jgi:putative spermidine/putrescine transport system ATP-binding protein